MKTKEKQKALKCMGIKAYMHQRWLNMTTTEGIQRDKCFYCQPKILDQGLKMEDEKATAAA